MTAKRRFEYTTWANIYTARFPFLTYLGTQVNFWIIANFLLVLILWWQYRIISLIQETLEQLDFGIVLFVSVSFGLFYGLFYGLFTSFLERNLIRNSSLWKVFTLKAIASVILLSVMFLTLNKVLLPNLFSSFIAQVDPEIIREVESSIFYLFLVYYFFMSLLISYINQVNKKYGPGVLLPLLLGKYRQAKEEEKIFMFMDLKSSTMTAEQLGHLRYSAFISNCFSDINEKLFSYQAQVYQYVGDEIVIMWPEKGGMNNSYCLDFFFAVKNQFQLKKDFYLKEFGMVPSFKAGIHSGKVSAVEIGEIKKDIAYHGDTLNTASRIQGLCNDFGKELLVSKILIDKLKPSPYYQFETVGDFLLKGKSEKITIISVKQIDDSLKN